MDEESRWSITASQELLCMCGAPDWPLVVSLCLGLFLCICVYDLLGFASSRKAVHLLFFVLYTCAVWFLFVIYWVFVSCSISLFHNLSFTVDYDNFFIRCFLFPVFNINVSSYFPFVSHRLLTNSFLIFSIFFHCTFYFITQFSHLSYFLYTVNIPIAFPIFSLFSSKLKIFQLFSFSTFSHLNLLLS